MPGLKLRRGSTGQPCAERSAFRGKRCLKVSSKLQIQTLVISPNLRASGAAWISVLYWRFPNHASYGPSLNRARNLLLMLVAIVLALPLCAQEANKPEDQLVERILSRTGGPASISLTVTNLSSLPAGEAERSRHELERQFLLHGVRIVAPEQAVVNVIVTLSENARETLWIAEILEGQTREVMILPIKRALSAPAQNRENSFSLQSKRVLAQDSPILDFAEIPSTSGAERQLLVLSPDKLSLYALQPEKAQLLQEIKLDNVALRTRDPRGRIFLHDNLFEAYLPGYRCTGNTAGTILAACQQSDDPWPLLPQLSGARAFYANARNFFTGVITDLGRDYSFPGFFSAAVLGGAEGDHFVLAGTDGRLQSGNGTRFGISSGAGIASIKPDCTATPLILSSRNGDWSQNDAVRLLTESGIGLEAVSHEVELPGPVLSMWSAGPVQVNISIRNLQTGAYEAYIVSAACTH